MTYSLPFAAGAKVLEVGGGDNPLKPGEWQNFDCRSLPTVDIVGDLNDPWPIKPDSYDGAIGMYIIEHISWRRVQQFVNETHRVLKPEGIAVFFTANLLEQCRLAISWFEMGKGEEVNQMIWGDQNYEGGDWVSNAHHCGFSPDYALKLFKEAGFYEATIFQHPQTATDMIIQAKKSGAVVH